MPRISLSCFTSSSGITAGSTPIALHARIFRRSSRSLRSYPPRSAGCCRPPPVRDFALARATLLPQCASTTSLAQLVRPRDDERHHRDIAEEWLRPWRSAGSAFRSAPSGWPAERGHGSQRSHPGAVCRWPCAAIFRSRRSIQLSPTMRPSRSMRTIISARRSPLKIRLGVIQTCWSLSSQRALILPPVEVIRPFAKSSLLHLQDLVAHIPITVILDWDYLIEPRHPPS